MKMTSVDTDSGFRIERRVLTRQECTEIRLPEGRLATEWTCIGSSTGDVQIRCIVTENPELDRHGQRTALIGWYDGVNDHDAGREILEAIVRHSCAEGYTRVLGPMNHDTWHAYRVPLPSDEPPFFLDVPTPACVAKHFRSAGFVPVESYHSTEHDLEQSDVERTERFRRIFAERGISIRSIDPERFDNELELIYAVAVEAFASNPLYTPIPKTEATHLYSPLEPLLDPDFAMIAEDRDGTPLAFILAVDDGSRPPGERVVVKTVATRPGRSGAGLGTLLVEMVHASGLRRGYCTAVHALMHDRNPSTRIAGNGRTIRRYILFGRACDPENIGEWQ